MPCPTPSFWSAWTSCPRSGWSATCRRPDPTTSASAYRSWRTGRSARPTTARWSASPNGGRPDASPTLWPMTSAHELGIDDDVDDFEDLAGARLLHDRPYRVRAYYEDEGHMRIRGMVRDRKPAGLYITGDDRPLLIHHMVVDLTVAYPTLAIDAARVVIETHPHDTCPRTEDHYANLVGLSIARGFTHKVRELFGGPRGCTHTTALLQAIAPVAVQSVWSMRAVGDAGTAVGAPRVLTPEERLGM